MKEFFGIGGYTREPEGYLSPQHLLFVTVLMVIMTGLPSGWACGIGTVSPLTAVC